MTKKTYFVEYVFDNYGYFGVIAMSITVVVVMLAWIAISLAFIWPFFLPVAFVVWMFCKYCKDPNA